MKKIFHCFVRPHVALLVIATSLFSAVIAKDAYADVCLEMTTKKYSDFVDLATKGGSLIPGPVAEAVVTGAEVGTSVGQLVNFGLSWWWDPHVEVFPNSSTSIGKPISDAEITGIANGVLQDLSQGSPFTVTFADLQSLNTVSPGMGTAATDLLIDSIRAFVDTAQGAAASAQDGFGAPSVLAAADLLNSDLAAYRESLATYSSFVAAFDNTPGVPTITVSNYLDFLTDVKTHGDSALPPGEVAAGQRMLNIADVHIVGSTLSNSLVGWLSQGDTGNEAAQIPAGGLTMSELLASGINAFNIDCRTCTIASAPEPSTWLLFATGLACLVWWRVRTTWIRS